MSSPPIKGTKYILCICLLLAIFDASIAFFLSTSAPVNFCPKEWVSDNCQSNVTLYVSHLTSDRSLIPYDYGHFGFCLSNDTESREANFGLRLRGEETRPSEFQISFNDDKRCALLCEKNYIVGEDGNEAKIEQLLQGIRLNYMHSWIVDGMPVVFCYVNAYNMMHCDTSFPMGCRVTAAGRPMGACVFDPRFYSQPASSYLFNHVDMEIAYRENSPGDQGAGGRIVSIRLIPRSIKHDSKQRRSCNAQSSVLKITPDMTHLNVIYTYTVSFVKSNIKWSSRWDYILNSSGHSNMLWQQSLANSLIIVAVLTGVLGVILLRVLRPSTARFLRLDEKKGGDAHGKPGWKSLHADVFRPPRCSMLLAVLVGSGCQLGLVALGTLLLASIGLLSPANRGAFVTCTLLVYECLAPVAGYVSARIYKSLGGLAYKANVLFTALLCPAILFGVFLGWNAILLTQSSSAVVRLDSLVTLLVQWLIAYAPLTLVGAHFGARKSAMKRAYGTMAIKMPREIPPKTYYTLKLVAGVLFVGLVSFQCVFFQLSFILNSLWAHQTYYMFGYLLLACLMLAATCAEATVLLCYYHLCAENYHWWRRSFLTGGFTAVYVFIDCTHYFFTKLAIEGFVSTVLYFSYTAAFVFMFFLITGTIGFMASYWFIRAIYASVEPVSEIASVEKPLQNT